MNYEQVALEIEKSIAILDVTKDILKHKYTLAQLASQLRISSLKFQYNMIHEPEPEHEFTGDEIEEIIMDEEIQQVQKDIKVHKERERSVTPWADDVEGVVSISSNKECIDIFFNDVNRLNNKIVYKFCKPEQSLFPTKIKKIKNLKDIQNIKCKKYDNGSWQACFHIINDIYYYLGQDNIMYEIKDNNLVPSKQLVWYDKNLEIRVDDDVYWGKLDKIAKKWNFPGQELIQITNIDDFNDIEFLYRHKHNVLHYCRTEGSRYFIGNDGFTYEINENNEMVRADKIWRNSTM